MSVIEDLEPKIVWKHFDEIRKIPRCSKHEEKIREYIVNFAKKLNLEYKVDKAGNVVIRKTASPGMENKPIVVLQGHMDMVCEKNANVKHDFSKDPIKLVKKGDVLTADGTTLGADNGIGLAIMLAILEDKNLKHGPIEALFTVDEETGLTGAFAIQPGFLKGRIMLNLDSEDFGIITIGSAGGGGSKIELPVRTQKNQEGLKPFIVKVTGLRGGHSGVDIHEQRGNAIKILARLLWKAMQNYELLVSDIRGGDKHNAIPREATAVVLVNEKEVSKFVSSLQNEAKDITNEIKTIDPNFTLKIEETKKPEEILDKESTFKLVNLLYSLPHGVDRMSYDVPGLVETSTNLAKTSIEKDRAVIEMSSRSATKSELEDMRGRIKAIASLAGAKTTEDEPYPGWKPNLDSRILALAKKVFREMYRKEPKVEAIHAGLECGIIGEKFPGMDMISIGPTIKYPHSPDEQVEISTVDKFYKYVLKILENI
ncbi:MAG: cytosol nonspecific dipeptidase [Thermoplasmata archaeon]|nr:MAG: cytosol nonspecific dipeptidase [Thermoplasmata archaeon]